MAMNPDNRVGEYDCECGRVAELGQSAKAGKYLYKSCVCGLDQNTKVDHQNYWWRMARFDEGKEVVKPKNIIDDWSPEIKWMKAIFDKPTEPITEVVSEPVTEPVSEKPSELQPKMEQSSPDLTEQDIAQKATDSKALERTGEQKGGGLRVIGVVMMFLSFLGVAWTQI